VYVQPSFDKVVPPSFYELGLAELVCIYNELREIGKAPPVIDAAELQQDPEVFNELKVCLAVNMKRQWPFLPKWKES